MDKYLEKSLKNCRLFKGVPEEDVSRILSAAFPVHHVCQPGEVLVEAGDVSDRFGLVLRGVLTASRPLTTGEDHLAKYLSVNRSALSKELNDMRREGLIDFKRDQFTLK